MIIYTNKDETIRIRKEYEDYNACYFYVLEKYYKPEPSWIDKLLGREPKGCWHNGMVCFKGCMGIPPSRTYYEKQMKSWVKHYELQESTQ